MPDRFAGIEDAGLDGAMLRLVIDEHRRAATPRLEKLWAYFRDPVEPVGASGGAVGQARGLPRRFRDKAEHADCEVVIENDIAWRVQTMIDFMFGRPVKIESTAEDEAVRGTIERVLDAVWEASGGIGLMQDMSLLGHVYGYVDLLVRLDEESIVRRGVLIDALESGSRESLAELIRIEPVEPRRGIPVLDADDYRRLDAFVVHFDRSLNEVDGRGPAARMSRLFGKRGRADGGDSKRGARRRGTVTEVLGRGRRLVWPDPQPAWAVARACLLGMSRALWTQLQGLRDQRRCLGRPRSGLLDQRRSLRDQTRCLSLSRSC